MSGAARALVGVVRFYQRHISPALPPTCRYTPTCSAYAVQALTEHGAWKGSWLALRRLGRCGPWSRHDHVDLVPEPSARRRAKLAARQARPARGASESATGSTPVTAPVSPDWREPRATAHSSSLGSTHRSSPGTRAPDTREPQGRPTARISTGATTT